MKNLFKKALVIPALGLMLFFLAVPLVKAEDYWWIDYNGSGCTAYSDDGGSETGETIFDDSGVIPIGCNLFHWIDPSDDEGGDNIRPIPSPHLKNIVSYFASVYPDAKATTTTTR